MNVLRSEQLTRPKIISSRTFLDVLEDRRSSVQAGSPPIESIADLLWYTLGVRGHSDAGRAGLATVQRPTPSAGGLGTTQVIVITNDGAPPRLYDAWHHAWQYISVDENRLRTASQRRVREVLASHHGTTLCIVGDMERLSTGYKNGESLFLREAGFVAATACLCAAWLGLAACPLGFLGQDLVPLLGLPSPRFAMGGGVQISQ